MQMWFADLVGGVVVLILGATVIYFSSQLDYYSEFGPGPGFLPLWVGIIIAGCAIYLLIDILRKHKSRSIEVFFKPRTKLGLQILATILITYLLLPLVGFAIGLALFIGVTMRMMGKHHWALCSLTTVVTAIGIHFVFVSWLTIPLPQGLIGW